MNRTLTIARKKLQYSKGLNQLYAHLTPSEIHALIDDGYAPAKSQRVPTRNETRQNARCFYFEVKRGEFYTEK
jgi:hypothetical protein